MSWGFVAAGAATVVGGALGSKGQKDAAETSAGAAKYQADIAKKIYDQTREDLMPFQELGVSSIPMLLQSMQPIDRAQALSDYYSGPEYSMMSEQASRNLLAGAEAGAGIGSSSTANNLMRIAPSMGTNYLSMLESQRMDDFNRAMGLAGMGQNAAAQVGSAGQSYASQAGQAYGAAGQNIAASQLASANLMGQTVGSLGGLGYQYFNRSAPAASNSGANYEQGMGSSILGGLNF